jgi:hypothetical protein
VTRLRAFKRDLLNLGLTEAQAHEIIPDATTAPGATAPRSPNGGTADGGEAETTGERAGA